MPMGYTTRSDEIQIMPILATYTTIMKTLVTKAMEYRFCVAPNPPVGSALLLNNTIVAEGFHTVYGGEHAEIACISSAKKNAIPLHECTLLITLEPCSHYGKTPPCVETIVASGIRTVVIGTKDPTLLGEGIRYLRANGVTVTVLEDSASQYAIQAFTTWNTQKIPHCILKLASTIDGYIATPSYKSQWITNQESRAYMQKIRSMLGTAGGGILVGANTVRYDNPKLYAHGYTGKQPIPIIIARNLDNLEGSYLLTERAQECILITIKENQDTNVYKILEQRGVTFIITKGTEQLYPTTTPPVFSESPTTASLPYIHLAEALRTLYTMYTIPYILCEGGGNTAYSLVSLPINLELWHITAPRIFADNTSLPMIYGNSIDTLDNAYSFTLQSCTNFSDDIFAIYTKNTPLSS